VSFVVLAVGVPLLLPLALLFDLVRLALRGTPLTASRLYLFGLAYTLAELVGLATLAATWPLAPAGSERSLAMTYAIQRAWAGSLFALARGLFGLRFEVEGAAALSPGPVLVLVRHASIVDTLVPTSLAGPLGMRLRFVLKRELLSLPCLDVAGNRLPNCFVARDGADTDAEVARVADLARGLGPRDGVLIYPEGTRFTASKLARAKERASERSPERAARVASLRHVLPVRPGGVLALLDANPEADVVLVAHAGLEGFAEVRDLLGGGFVGRRARISVRRIARAEVPASSDARLAWLDERWAEVDEWVHTHEPRGA
jgi:1-acyl-sn-glycerol-3-phosphate acyltransferase